MPPLLYAFGEASILDFCRGNAYDKCNEGFMVAREEEKRERIRYSGKEGVAMSKEFAQKEACVVPEGVFIIGTYDAAGVPNAAYTA